jgi:hypothetical protein
VGAAQQNILVTIAARSCPTYPDITANLARNNIQESLQDLGADTLYHSGEPISYSLENKGQPQCPPVPNWRFTLGRGYRSRAVTGPWGALSIVTEPFSTAIVTRAETPLLDSRGSPTGTQIAGAVTIALSQTQVDLASRPNSLWLQGGLTTDPVLDQEFPQQYGFGALRCAIDNLNGDNVEWISFPEGATATRTTSSRHRRAGRSSSARRSPSRPARRSRSASSATSRMRATTASPST